MLQFGHLWDGSKLLDNVTVTVEDGKIASIEPGRASLPAGAIDMRRYTAIPGLIDLHTHITYYWDRKPGTRPLGQRRRPRGDRLSRAGQRAPHARNRRDDDPRSRRVGRRPTTRCAIWSRWARWPARGCSSPARGISARPRLDAGSARRCAKLAEDRIKAGSDWVKVYGSRGSFDSVDTTQTLTFDEMKAIVDAAHALGHKVAIHSYGASGVKDAVRAGADSVEHGIELDDETLAEMVKRGTVWVPTIDHNRYYVDAKDDYGFKPEAIPPLQRLHREEPRVDAPRASRPA